MTWRSSLASAGRRVGVLLTAGAIVVGLAGCSDIVQGVVTVGVEDNGGLTLAQVEAMSTQERFELLGEHEARVRELMTPAQEQISTGPWIWGTAGPASLWEGVSQFDSLRGATDDNSYHMEMTRLLQVEGEPGVQDDAEKMALYFESQGWETSRSYVNTDRELDVNNYEVVAQTEDGYWLRYRVQETGYNNLTVFSGTFWAGDYMELKREANHRVSVDEFSPFGDGSLPGQYVPFPKWSDPKREGVE